MANESGDMKLLGNFRRLIDFVSAEPNYKPSNKAIQIAGLEAQYAAGLAAVNDIAVNIAPNKVAINERQIAFEGLNKLVTRSINVLRASGASDEIVKDAQTYSRKLSAKRKVKKETNNPDTPEKEAASVNSVSQLSYDNQLGHFRTFIQITANEPVYDPNEMELKTSSLTALADSLEAKNNAVSASFVVLSQSRGIRDGLLYLNSDSIVNVAALVKEYVRGAFGATSQLFRQIRGLQFRK